MPGGLTFTWTPGKQFAPGELVDNDKLNLLGQGTGTITGNIQGLDNVSATLATVTGQPFVWDVAAGKWGPGIVAAAYMTEMVGCTGEAAGVKGIVKAPQAGDGEKYWAGDATWRVVPSASAVDGANLFLATRFV